MHSHPILWEHSRRMERERDEAIHGSCVNYNFTQDARRERDEAQYKLEDARQSLEVALGDLSEAKRERDEAREELRDIRLNLGADAEGYTLLHAVCALQNERDELLERNAKLRDIADRALMLNQSQ